MKELARTFHGILGYSPGYRSRTPFCFESFEGDQFIRMKHNIKGLGRGFDELWRRFPTVLPCNNIMKVKVKIMSNHTFKVTIDMLTFHAYMTQTSRCHCGSGTSRRMPGHLRILRSSCGGSFKRGRSIKAPQL